MRRLSLAWKLPIAWFHPSARFWKAQLSHTERGISNLKESKMAMNKAHAILSCRRQNRSEPC
jgi:hypothetical protein